jgi:hypothetical protein
MEITVFIKTVVTTVLSFSLFVTYKKVYLFFILYFSYVLTTLDELITEDYILIYLHGATSRSCMPTFSWLKRCYQMIDRRLRKNLKGLYLVHPTFWLKTIVIMTRPFIR